MSGKYVTVWNCSLNVEEVCKLSRVALSAELCNGLARCVQGSSPSQAAYVLYFSGLMTKVLRVEFW
jgi:hypothetical protein